MNLVLDKLTCLHCGACIAGKLVCTNCGTAVHYGFDTTAQRDLEPALEDRQEEGKHTSPHELKSTREEI